MAAETFSFTRDLALKALKLPWFLIIALRARFSQRDPDLWVVGRRYGVGDGPLAIVRQLMGEKSSARIVWLTLDAQDDRIAMREGIEFVRRDSVEGLQLCLRAGFGIMTNGFSDLRGPAIWGACAVQLWHGAPLKRIGADRLKRRRTKRWSIDILYSAFERYWNGHYSVVIAGSDVTACRLGTALSVPAQKVVVTGDPRMDLITDSVDAARQELAHLARTNGVTGSCFVLLAPTWRDGGDSQIARGPLLDRLLLTHPEVVLFVRAHPFSSEVDALKGAPNVVALPPGEYPDLTSLLGAFDVLMTDYSSAAMDYAPLGRPIVFVAPDLQEYEKSPGLYEDYGSFTKGLWFCTWDEAFARVSRLLEGDHVALAEHCACTQAIARKYHPLGTAGNTCRALAVIRSAGHAP